MTTNVRLHHTEEAVARIHEAGEKEVLLFIEEVPAQKLMLLVSILPTVPGFRKNSITGLKQMARSLAKRIASKPHLTAPSRDKDYIALYAIWRMWASANISDAKAINSAIDQVEKAFEKYSKTSNSDELKSEVANLFSILRDLSHENRCDREKIERLFKFSPFSTTDQIEALIKGSKKHSEVERDAAITKLPQRLSRDEEDISQLKSSYKSNADEIQVVKAQLVSLLSEVSSVQKQVSELRETLPSNQKQPDSQVTKLEEHLSMFSEVIERISGDLDSTSATVVNLTTTIEAHKSNLSSEIDNSRKDTAALSYRIAELQNQIDALGKDKTAPPADVTSTDFDIRLKALEDRISNLGNTPSVKIPAHLDTAQPSNELSIIDISAKSDPKQKALLNEKDVIRILSDTLAASGLKKSVAQGFAIELTAAVLLGQTIFFKGAYATEVARLCAYAVAPTNCHYLSIPIGLLDTIPLRDSVEGRRSGLRAIVLEGVNRSAADIICSVIKGQNTVHLDPQITSSSSSTLFFASLVDSAASLPIEPTYLELGPIFDLDHLEWRLRGAQLPITALGTIDLSEYFSLRTMLTSGDTNTEEVIRLIRKFLRRPNPRIERVAVSAYCGLQKLRPSTAQSSALQSLAFGWLVPLWIAHSVDKQSADLELDSGKVDHTAADARLVSILASDDLKGEVSGGVA